MTPLVVEIPIRLVSEANRREHWAAKAKRVKHQRTMVGLVMAAHLAASRIVPPCVVTLTRIAPRQLDSDNAVSSLKATRDGLSDALGIDDRDARVAWLYGQRRGKARQYAVVIEVRPA